MIISASRRCDVPNYKSDWFLDSLKAGEILLPTHSFISKKITLRKDIIDCIVFWTKNPEPMIPRIHELDGYPYYFQFTITGYAMRPFCIRSYAPTGCAACFMTATREA